MIGAPAGHCLSVETQAFDEPALWRAEIIRDLGIRGVERCAAACPDPGFPQLLDSMLRVLTDTPRGPWIDVGGGLGGVSDWLLRRSPRRVVMFEPAPGRCAAAHRLFPLLPVVQAPAERLPLPGGSVSAVVASGVVSLLDDLDDVVGECARVLRPGGVVAIADLWSTSSNSVHSDPNVFWAFEDVVAIADRHPLEVADVAVCAVETGWWSDATEQVDDVIRDAYADRAGYADWVRDQDHIREVIESGVVLAGAISLRRT